MEAPSKNIYNELKPSPCLKDFVHSYWQNISLTDESWNITIVPDSYFKIVFFIREGKITSFFITGIWTKEVEVALPPNVTVYGIRLKILAPEYLLQREIASIKDALEDLDLGYWEAYRFSFSSFQHIVDQFEFKFLEMLIDRGLVQGNKLSLSQFLDQCKGQVTAEEVSRQIGWSNRQVNRYLNKYIGVSIKSYLNIQKIYYSYVQIREGNFFPDEGYYDQAHFIREVRKHTGHTPRQLFKEQNDRFIQLKDIVSA